MIEKNYDFRKRLLQIHKPKFINSTKAVENAFNFKEPVTVYLSDCKDVVMSTAVNDFIDCLEVSFNTKAVKTDEAEKAQIKVCLACENNTDLGEAASYRGFLVKSDESGVCVYGHDNRGAAQGLYYLEDVMSFEGATAVPYGDVCKKPLFSPQMVHSGYGVDEYPDNYLSRIAHEGRDAILVFVKDVNTTPTGYLDFNDLICRAKRYGLDVYAYSKLLSDKHPDDPDAEEYYEGTYGKLFRECPELKGVTLVGESVEFPSNDPNVFKGHYYERSKDGIPISKPSPGWYPCEDYPKWLNMIKKIIRKYNDKADIVFWTYNWGYQPEELRVKLIESLPTDISLEATFEMFEPRKVGNSTIYCADYTLSFEGPGKYFESEAIAAKKRGIKLYSMTNTGGLTWDMGVIPYEPMPFQWMKRYAVMRKAHKDWGLCGIMEGHHYGFYPSFISKLSKWCFWSPEEDMEEILRKILVAEYGKENYESVLSALKLWSDAIGFYTPTDADQYGAFRIGPTYPFTITAALNIPYDKSAMFGARICMPNYYFKLDARSTPLSIRIYDEIKSLEKMLDCMEKGVSYLENITKSNENLDELLNLGRFMRNMVITGINAKKWYILKCRLTSETEKSKLQEVINEMTAILHIEKENVEATIPLVEQDSRLGWEPSMLYLTDKWHLEWKLRQIEYTLNSELETYKKSLMK